MRLEYYFVLLMPVLLLYFAAIGTWLRRQVISNDSVKAAAGDSVIQADFYGIWKYVYETDDGKKHWYKYELSAGEITMSFPRHWEKGNSIYESGPKSIESWMPIGGIPGYPAGYALVMIHKNGDKEELRFYLHPDKQRIMLRGAVYNKVG